MIPDGLENKRLAAIRRKAALDDNWSKLKKWMARSQSGIPIWILKCHIPALPPGTRLEDLDLSWRIFHRLESHGFRDRPEKLGRLTVEEFFDISGLAAKSLRELLSSIRGITKKISRSTENARSASIGPGATPKHDLLKLKKWLATGQDVVPSLLWSCRLPAPPPGTRLDALSLSWQVFNSLEASGMCDRVERLGELTVKKILEIPGFGQRSLRELLSAIFERSSAREIGNRVGSERRGQAAAMAARNLEEELIRLLTRNRSSRSEYYAGILVRRSGFDGCGEKTFREIGQEFGITHERVRQICVLLETRLRAAHPPRNSVS